MNYTLTNGHLRFNDGVKFVEDNFKCNEAVTCDMNEVLSIGNDFLYYNEVLTEISLPNVTSIGNYFLYYNEVLTEISLPNVTSIGNYFLYCNEVLTEISLPNVTSIGNDFLYYNEVLTEISLPNVTSIGNYFLYYNKVLTEISLPNVTSIGNDFLYWNEVLTEIKTKSHNFKVIKKDNQTFVINSQKSKGEISIYSGFILNSITNDVVNKKDCYLVCQGEFSAHGDTLKQALSGLENKVNFDKLSKEPINEDTIITIERYHAATGSCKTGIKNWMEVNQVKEGFTAKELLPILEKYQAYGLERFKKLITF